jgi:hypothetical protein
MARDTKTEVIIVAVNCNTKEIDTESKKTIKRRERPKGTNPY